MNAARTMLTTSAIGKLQWQHFLPIVIDGEVAPSYGDGGVKES